MSITHWPVILIVDAGIWTLVNFCEDLLHICMHEACLGQFHKLGPIWPIWHIAQYLLGRHEVGGVGAG